VEISGGVRDLYFNHFESMLKLIDGESPNASLHLPNGWEIRRAYNRIVFQSVMNADVEFEYEIVAPGHTDLPLLNAEMAAAIEGRPMNHAMADKLPDGKFRAVFDLDRLQLPLKLRCRRDGDRFQPFGMRGSKKLKDFFIDAKVPRHERGHVPVLVSGDQIIWVVGYRTGEQFKIREKTERCLYLTYSSCPKN
jgi:tRNA(Ile)-lysidine synthase